MAIPDSAGNSWALREVTATRHWRRGPRWPAEVVPSPPPLTAKARRSELRMGQRIAINVRIGRPSKSPCMKAKYAHVVDMAKKNPALFIPAKMG